MLNKLKDFYRRNRVYSILMIVSIICIISILVGVILYFLGQTSKDKYGNRLDGIEKIKISEKKQDELENKISENELVNKTTIDVRGKLIYIDFVLESGKHTDAEAIAQSILEMFSEDERNYYDIQFIVENLNKEEEENFPIMGYIKKGNSLVKWTNYIQ